MKFPVDAPDEPGRHDYTLDASQSRQPEGGNVAIDLYPGADPSRGFLARQRAKLTAIIRRIQR